MDRYFGSYLKPANVKTHRRDRRLTWNQNGERKVVGTVQECDGNSVLAVFNLEKPSCFVRSRASRKETVLHAGEAASWDNLHERFGIESINHQEAYSLHGACTNMVAEYSSRLHSA